MACFFRKIENIYSFFLQKNISMKNSFISFSAYLVALLVGISFFVLLFNLLVFNYFLGLGLILWMILITVVLVMDPNFIQEAEENY